jgi:hypothetical protein
MTGLFVVGCGVVGGVIGGCLAIPAMMLWADMDGLGVITWVPSGVAVGAAVGVYAGAQIAG